MSEVVARTEQLSIVLLGSTFSNSVPAICLRFVESAAGLHVLEVRSGSVSRIEQMKPGLGIDP